MSRREVLKIVGVVLTWLWALLQSIVTVIEAVHIVSTYGVEPIYWTDLLMVGVYGLFSVGWICLAICVQKEIL